MRKWEPNAEYLKQFIPIQPGGAEPLILPEAIEQDIEFRHGKLVDYGSKLGALAF